MKRSIPMFLGNKHRKNADSSPVVKSLMEKLDTLPRFEEDELEAMSPLVLRALVVLHTGDHPMPHTPQKDIIALIRRSQGD